jgi:hypothetical protein
MKTQNEQQCDWEAGQATDAPDPMTPTTTAIAWFVFTVFTAIVAYYQTYCTTMPAARQEGTVTIWDAYPERMSRLDGLGCDVGARHDRKAEQQGLSDYLD